MRASIKAKMDKDIKEAVEALSSVLKPVIKVLKKKWSDDGKN